MAENKSEIKPFLFKKYIYCVCVKYRFSQWLFIVFRGESNWGGGGGINPQIIHYSSKLYCALACGAVGERLFRAEQKPMGDTKVRYNQENSLQLADLFLVWMSNYVKKRIALLVFRADSFSYHQPGYRWFFFTSKMVSA